MDRVNVPLVVIGEPLNEIPPAPAMATLVTDSGPGGPGGPVWKILAFAISVGFVWVIVKLPIIAAMVV
jgi:hypothetical protein